MERRPILRTLPLLLPAAALLLSGCVTIQLLDGRGKELIETTVHGDAGPKILLVQIDGVISETAPEPVFLLGTEDSTVARMREDLTRAREDASIAALLLRIDSPGGTATASDIIYSELVRYKRETGVPIVAQLMGTATSGGYYVAMAADRVIAHPTTVTGSIGVIFSGVNVAGLMEKLGVEDQTITSGEHKDTGTPLRRMTDEERAQIQSVLDDLHARFEQVVVQGRSGLDAKEVRTLADGRVFSASQAEASGLIDEIGDLEEAVARAEGLAGIPSSRVVTYHRPREWQNNLYTGPAVPATVKLDLGLPPWATSGPRFLYLWSPAAR